MSTFESWNVGDHAKFEHRITQEDIQKFVEITGDDNPLHVDRAFAEKTSFKGVVAHGMLSASFFSTIIGKYIPGDGALWVSQNISFLLPVRCGDELCIYAEIVKKHEKQRLLTLKTEITNQYKEKVLVGDCQVKVLEVKQEKIKENPLVKKIVLITGASRGIGAATAILLAQQGWSVAVNYCTDQNGAKNVVQQIKNNGGHAIIVQADVTKRQEVRDMVERVVRQYGTISGLVNNASSKIIAQEFASLEWGDIQKHLDVHLQGAFNCIQEVLPEFLTNKKGAVVNIGSIYSDGTPPVNLLGYISAKSSLYALTKALAVELGPKGIRVNMVSPGMTETLLIANIPEKTRLLTEMQTPLRRLAQPEDIAQNIAFVLSDNASYLTGTNIRVCGGQMML
ncbi:MAG: SDR family oxidoreductase [SAR324 cluster bacterium]|nr:SDR family oxidoreductase [SAR324 cluster bacterium]